MFGQTRGTFCGQTRGDFAGRHGRLPLHVGAAVLWDGERDVGRYAQNHSQIDSKSFKQTVVDFRNDFLLILRPQADQGRFSCISAFWVFSET